MAQSSVQTARELEAAFLAAVFPELNPQEHIWHELRQKWFHNTVFDSLDALEDQLVTGPKDLEANPAVVKSITGWGWIINCISNGKYN